MICEHHNPSTCDDVLCKSCLDYSREESVILLETALLQLESSPEGAGGEWVDLPLTIEALDLRNVLDLLR